MVNITRIFKKDKIDPSRIALGCKPIKERPGFLECEPTYENEDGVRIPISEDLPIVIKSIGKEKFMIVEGGKDLTVKEIEALNKALERVRIA